MFNIGFAELILVLLVAFLVVGPKDLPKVARWLGRMVKRMRQMIRELKEEVGWNELTQETDVIGQEMKETLREADVRADLKQASQQLTDSVNSAKKETAKAIQEAKK